MIKRIAAVFLILVLTMTGLAYGAEKPELTSYAGVVIDASTGEVLMGKDEETAYAPASITKAMTALLVLENCSLDDKVKFSKTAVEGLESGAVTMNLAEGDELTVRDCLYALLLRSCNEVANGLAEHVSGSVDNFAVLMNERAKQLGCTNTNFVNPNGLNSKSHYTTAHDMALIGAAAFANDTIREIDTAESHKMPATKNHPDGFTVKRTNKIFDKTTDCYYENAIASKTGYTSKAGNTLLTMAEKDGKRLVAVTLKGTVARVQYKDTIALFNYGFEILNERAQNENTQETQAETEAVPEDPQPLMTIELVGPGINAQ